MLTAGESDGNKGSRPKGWCGYGCWREMLLLIGLGGGDGSVEVSLKLDVSVKTSPAVYRDSCWDSLNGSLM